VANTAWKGATVTARTIRYGRHTRPLVAGAVALATATALAAALPALGPNGAGASSHREAPQILGLPQYDTTDVYAFVSPDTPDTVTMIANWIPFEEPAGGPNFYPFATDARYEINIDNNGDARPDIVYRWTFRNDRTPGPANSFTGNGTFLYNNGPVTSLNDENLLFRQSYTLSRLDAKRDSWFTLLDRAPVAPSYVGKASMPNYAGLRNAAVKSFGSTSAHGAPTGFAGGKSFAGQADDPFFLDLRVFDLLYGGDLSEVGSDTLAGFNVNTVALQVPKKDLTAGDNVVGIWSTTSKRNSSGDWVQVSRLGSPLVNEVVVPYHRKDRFNHSQPANDAQFAPFVLTPELPKIVQAVYGIPAPATPRNDLVAAFLSGVDGLNKPAKVTPSEMLRLNVNQFSGQQDSRLGVIGGDKNGFPNGRRLTDDVVDIALQVVEGKLLPNHPAAVDTLGDGVDVNDNDFSNVFPYVALPHSGSDPRGAAAANSTEDQGKTALDGGASTGGTPSTEPGAGSGSSDSTGGAADGSGGMALQAERASSDEPMSSATSMGLAAAAGLALLGGSAWMWRRRRHAHPVQPGQTGTVE
jgi:hypothetical protein